MTEWGSLLLAAMTAVQTDNLHLENPESHMDKMTSHKSEYKIIKHVISGYSAKFWKELKSRCKENFWVIHIKPAHEGQRELKQDWQKERDKESSWKPRSTVSVREDATASEHTYASELLFSPLCFLSHIQWASKVWESTLKIWDQNLIISKGFMQLECMLKL